MDSTTPQPKPIGQIIAQTEPPFAPDAQPITQAPTDGRDTTWVKNFGKFERLGSSFSWHIYVPGRQKFYGFSKPKGMAEKTNKQELLQDIIRRLNKNGYIRDRNRVVFFRNFGDTDDDSVKLFTMYGSRYDPEPAIVGQAWLIQFLFNFYNPSVNFYGSELFPTGEKATQPPGMAIIPDSSKQAPPKDPFSMDRRFRDANALMSYGEKLERDGHAHGLVLDYLRKMNEKYFQPT